MNYVDGIDDIYQLLEIEEIDSQDILILKKYTNMKKKFRTMLKNS